MKIFAPYPGEQIFIVLPNPEMGDIQRLESKMILKRSMNGAVKVTHIKKMPNVRSYEYNLLLTRLKSLEFYAFYELFGSEQMRIEHDNDVDRIGYIRINPLELDVSKRSLVGSSIEEVSVRFDFETIE